MHGASLILRTFGMAPDRATADELYDGVAPAIPKINDAYVWGMTLAGDKIFFGTVANTLCLVQGTFLQNTDPVRNDAWVCEFADSPLYDSPQFDSLPPPIGDWRPPFSD